MIPVGEPAPDAEVWLAPNHPVSLLDLAAPGEALLVLFYLFDWSGT